MPPPTPLLQDCKPPPPPPPPPPLRLGQCEPHATTHAAGSKPPDDDRHDKDRQRDDGATTTDGATMARRQPTARRWRDDDRRRDDGATTTDGVTIARRRHDDGAITAQRAALARGLSNSSAMRSRLERPPIPRFAPRRSVRDRFRPLATDQLHSPFPTSPHSRAAFTLQHRRTRDRRGPVYDRTRPAEACATARDASRPLDPALNSDCFLAIRDSVVYQRRATGMLPRIAKPPHHRELHDM
ncbi:hypothetical protein EDB85DRAFT_2144681 [Lactarius pseudohatsudake]|nr:hypothetical protein EDB85DRAFT_2144681 [Lactarius pseudohatsudake]